MSLNTAHANNGVLIFAGESIILYCDNVTLEFSGNSGAEFRGSKQGRVYLTTHRMIFNNKSTKDTLQSFSFPFMCLSEVELEQPLFGANYIRGKVRAEPYGNWVGEAKFKLQFKSGGAIEYGQAMLQAARLASRNAGPNWNGPPPPYSPPGNYRPADPSSYAPNPTGYYGWNPPLSTFPDHPPANSVYMYDAPPPYPGITPSSPAQASYASSQDAKAAEAAQSAYYDPNYPGHAYVPQPAYYMPPPKYDDIKKMD